ncbi:DUF1329 domain-containing protein [Sinimarinibacterium sp. NLF-5-8]|uniref:DUF1329 domain-containing protein n=1 Tax=Sinimarinibacterium sp. NLF-5-8 TaxID=2698684 RepID=UPI00137BDD8A|nr:DUF1329 domain-containing protein [Sinimarinibacterium sp. NLF-5-8]QHS10462.1 DUF1329 domain-containing protein [Sinimarinibacterium sp. NLF-5-8]
MRWIASLGMAFWAFAASPISQAKVSAEQAAQLGGEQLTCTGAERAGSDAGVAVYSGQWIGQWPGMKKEQGFEPGPYADEKPLFTITAENAAQYAEHLTDGQKAMLEKYPQQFRMRVFPSHRDFGTPDWVCAAARYNAEHAEIDGDGIGVKNGQGGALAFPFPQNGLEAIWSVRTTHRAWTEEGTLDNAAVYPNGSISWGRMVLRTLAPMNDPTAKARPSLSDKIAAYFYSSILLPERDRGTVAVGYQFNNQAQGSTQAWAYQPGTRRVRQAPEVGYDYPVPPASLHTTDEDTGFNGATDRFTWKLIGKQERYVPYHNFAINDPAIKYSDLLSKGTVNPDYLRYELHRVWVVEATLKPELRHVYGKRRLYIDEDTWQILTADNYDTRGNLWRVPMILYFYAPAAQTYHRGVQLFHDLTAQAYEADKLVNEQPAQNWWVINKPMQAGQFSPSAAARAGR